MELSRDEHVGDTLKPVDLLVCLQEHSILRFDIVYCVCGCGIRAFCVGCGGCPVDVPVLFDCCGCWCLSGVRIIAGAHFHTSSEDSVLRNLRLFKTAGVGMYISVGRIGSASVSPPCRCIF